MDTVLELVLAVGGPLVLVPQPGLSVLGLVAVAHDNVELEAVGDRHNLQAQLGRGMVDLLVLKQIQVVSELRSAINLE